VIFKIPGYGNDANGNMWWFGIVAVIGLSFLLFELILRLWQKHDFVLGFEWCIGAIASRVLPVKKQNTMEIEGKPKWWQAGRLDVKNALISPEFINIVEADEIDHANQQEARLAWKLSWIGIIFFPIAITAYRIANGAKVTEPNNNYSKKAMIMSIIAIGITVAFITVFSFVSLNMLGIPI
jgi:hypothetical protein